MTYYSQRIGIIEEKAIDLPLLRRLFYATFKEYNAAGYFVGVFGYGDKATHPLLRHGNLGADVGAGLALRLGKINLWPIDECYTNYSEDDIFDMLEFLHSNIVLSVSVGSHGKVSVNFPEQNRMFRHTVNQYLKAYDVGYLLTDAGRIEHIPDDGMATLVVETPPSIDEANIESRIARAISLFHSRHSTNDKMRDAVRELGDVLEYMKTAYKLESLLTKKDASDLFNILNTFGIRHHKPDQQSDYDADIFYPWLFYYYLAAVRAAQKLLAKSGIVK